MQSCSLVIREEGGERERREKGEGGEKEEGERGRERDRERREGEREKRRDRRGDREERDQAGLHGEAGEGVWAGVGDLIWEQSPV